jgi:hypothetical protein
MIPNTEMSHLNMPLLRAAIARDQLATLRRNQSFGMSLKKAVRLGYVYLAKVIGTDDGKGNYIVEVVKSNTIQRRMSHPNIQNIPIQRENPSRKPFVPR